MTPAAIRALRLRVGVNQADFAAGLGVSRNWYQKIETGADEHGKPVKPSATLLRLLDAIGEGTWRAPEWPG
jgi:DNA-binding transcriptional regulator YiaG